MSSYKQQKHLAKPEIKKAEAPAARGMADSPSNQSMLDSAGLNESAGSAQSLPEDMRARLEQHFGYGLQNLQVRESQEAGKLGGKALTKGNVVHFQPGILQGRDPQSDMIIAHEVSHAVSQATEARYRGGEDEAVRVDPLSERAADQSARSFLTAGEMAAQSAGLQALPAAPAGVPAEGWGIGILRKKKGEHEQLTEEARKKAAAKHQTMNGGTNSPLASDEARMSLQYGARFNDLGTHSLPGMAWQMKVRKRDAFINQTHEGDMQFMHSMDTSGGDTNANVKKMQRYAQFASDVYQNRDAGGGKKLQDMNMLEYVQSQNDTDDPFQEMMLSTMMNPKALEKFDAEFNAKAENQGISDQERRKRRTAALKERVVYTKEEDDAARKAAREKYKQKKGLKKIRAGKEDEYIEKKAREAQLKKQSKYAMGTVGEFFTNGNEKLDAGLVALGSASHMLEDSFAGSHATRSDNLYQGTTPDTELTESGREISEKATPILGNADYTKQDSALLTGRHGKADKFEKSTEKKKRFKNPFRGKTKRQEEKQKKVDATLRATQGGSLARDTAAQYMLMNASLKEKNEAKINAGEAPQSYTDSLLGKFVADVTRADPNVSEHGVTPTGRGYNRKFEGDPGGKDGKKAIKAYRKLTGKHIVGNKHTTGAQRAEQLDLEINALMDIKQNGSDEAWAEHAKHASEMMANIDSMIAQLSKTPELENENQAIILKLGMQRDVLSSLLGDSIIV